MASECGFQPYIPKSNFVLEELLINDLNLYNDTNPNEDEKKKDLLKRIFGENIYDLRINLPLFCISRNNLFIDEHVYLNFYAELYNAAPIYIGAKTKFGPKAKIYSGLNDDLSLNENKVTRIGHSCWFGGSVTVKSGVTIGDRVVVGAGSVVVEDIPSDSLAVGNPAHVVKKINL